MQIELIQEYFETQNNQRKKELEPVIQELKTKKEIVDFGFDNFFYSPFASFYFISCFEDKKYREKLFKLSFNPLPNFVLNKLGKTISMASKCDWPNYFHDLYELRNIDFNNFLVLLAISIEEYQNHKGTKQEKIFYREQLKQISPDLLGLILHSLQDSELPTLPNSKNIKQEKLFDCLYQLIQSQTVPVKDELLLILFKHCFTEHKIKSINCLNELLLKKQPNQKQLHLLIDFFKSIINEIDDEEFLQLFIDFTDLFTMHIKKLEIDYQEILVLFYNFTVKYLNQELLPILKIWETFVSITNSPVFIDLIYILPNQDNCLDLIEQIVLKNKHVIEMFNVDEKGIVIIGRLANLFCEEFQERKQFVLDMFTKLINALEIEYSSPTTATSIDGTYGSPIEKNTTSLVYETFTLFIPWIQRFNTLDPENTSNLVCHLTNYALKAIQGPPKTAESCLNFMINLTKTLKPNLLNLESVNSTLMGIYNTDMNEKVYSLLWNFATNVFIYFPQDVKPNQLDWKTRAQQFSDFLKPCVNNIEYFCNLETVDNPEQTRKNLLVTFNILDSVLTSTKESSLSSREVTLAAIQPVFQHIPKLIFAFQNDTDGLERLLNLSTKLIEMYKTKIPKDTVTDLTKLVQSFVLQDQNLLSNKLHLLEAVARETSKIFDHLIPSFISFVQVFYPQVTHIRDIDTQILYFELVGKLILNHWNYFKANTGDFLLLLQLLVGSFNIPELDVARTNIATIQQINSQFRFYDTEYFKTGVFKPLLLFIFEVLLKNSPLREDFVEMVVDIIQTDVDLFNTLVIIIDSGCIRHYSEN
ncbi:Exportin-6 [Boothiomyces macroporosus]|uniref:Exportin-6 n=1 Tax=Boothiomyces macroporosus TaxID=261099 RepID=A0AAD5UM87_9FUNG|nr:Exportin-6 [Boothiomyces macroporosus]